MIKKQSLVTDTYFFIGESIILLLLILPAVIYFNNAHVSYVAYFFIVICFCGVFYILPRYSISLICLTLLPFLILPFYIFGSSILLSFIIAGVFIWRYIHISRETFINREIKYLIITAALVIINYILMQEGFLVLFLALQLINLVLGNTFSHLAASEVHPKDFNYKSIIYFIILIGIAIGVTEYIIGLSKLFVSQLWDKVIYFVFSIIGRVLILFQFVENIEVKRWLEEEGASNIGKLNDVENLDSLFEKLAPGMTLFLIIVAIVIIAGLIFLFLIFKRDKEIFKVYSSNYQEVQFISKPIKDKQVSYFKTLVRTQKSPTNFVRKKIHQFELKAKKLGLSRKPSETLEEWLQRFGITSYFNTYQKVRYGESNVSQREIDTLLEDLKHADKKLNSFERKFH